MNTDDLKRRFGEEFPAAVVNDGIRMPLCHETRFSRFFESDDHKMGCDVSRFMDGSASITVAELKREWPTWTEEERMDFCQSCAWLDKQSDFPDMLRFIMHNAGQNERSGIALPVAATLPCEEAFQLLLGALRASDIALGNCSSSNLAQGIARTKHHAAEATLRHHFEAVWAHTSLWDDDEFINWTAFNATTCIAHLIELGAPAADFEEQVRRLSQHACSDNRDSCRNFLSKHYAWLK